MSRLGAGRYLDQEALPEGTVTTVHQLTTADDAKVTGVLRGRPGARAVVFLMHPRQDVTHHAQVPLLLARGYAVWTQGSRSPNNDLTLIHEQALLDVAAGMAFLRDRGREHGFSRVITFGHSGGGPLFAFYIEQAALAPAARLARTPSGRPVPLAEADMPVPDGAVFFAPHPGQGELLLRCIDPSVVDEADPLSVDPSLDPFAPANGFAEPPASAHYDPAFVTRYTAAQRARVARLDDIARRAVADADEGRAAFKKTGEARDRRRSLAPRILTVFRTDADLRCVDLHLDPSERPYGSVFGKRPDLIDYGLVGFGRLSTAEAWLSTWSGLSSKASFLRCAPGVKVPTLLIGLTGDQAAFPAVTAQMRELLGATDLTYASVRGTHFGGPIAPGEPTGNQLAGEVIGPWLDERFAG